MHGIDEEDAKRIAKEKVVKRVAEIYGKKEEIEKEYAHLFKEGEGKLCGRSTQYIMKWIASVRMAEGVIKRRINRGKGISRWKLDGGEEAKQRRTVQVTHHI